MLLLFPRLFSHSSLSRPWESIAVPLGHLCIILHFKVPSVSRNLRCRFSIKCFPSPPLQQQQQLRRLISNFHPSLPYFCISLPQRVAYFDTLSFRRSMVSTVISHITAQFHLCFFSAKQGFVSKECYSKGGTESEAWSVLSLPHISAMWKPRLCSKRGVC